MGRLVKRIKRGTDVQLIFEVSKSFADKRQGGGVGCLKKTKVVIMISATVLSHSIPIGELPKKIETNRSIIRGPTSQLKY